MKRHTYEEVKKVFDDRECTLISTEYRRAKDKLTYRCRCGSISEISFDKFQRGQYCRKCSHTRTTDKLRKPIEDVRKIFERAGCTLVTENYTGNKQKLKFICECGNEHEMALAKFQAGQRCPKCKGDKIRAKTSGPLNHGYKPEKTDEERVKDRKYPEYKAWRKAVFERDNYSCFNCGERGVDLNAHHIYSYARYPELRTRLENGITLCKECHNQFHEHYGREDFTPNDTWGYLRGDSTECPI